MSEWDLREEILNQTQRWYLIAAVILVGGLFGWGVAALWPSPYRATMDLYVGLDAYRVATDRYISSLAKGEVTNPDDYKNWQIGQLNALVTSEGYAQEILRRLQDNDPYWNEFGVEELQDMQDVLWRNVGLWQLVFEASDPDRALQGVRVWEEVTLERVNRSIAHAKMVMVLDSKLQSLIDAQTQAKTSKAEVNFLKKSLMEVYTALSDMTANQPIPELKRQELLLLTGQGFKLGLFVEDSLDRELPSEDSLPQEYLTWLDGFILAAEEGVASLDTQITAIEQELNDVSKLYADEAKAARGLTVNLSIESISESSPAVTQIRPTGLLTLVGVVISVCVWALALLVRVNQQGKS